MKSLSIQRFFELGLKRKVPDLLPDYGQMLELGPGTSPIPNMDETLEYPDWDADTMAIPFEECSFDVVYALHILEHVKRPIVLLRDIQRVLQPGGHANIVIPHFKSELAFEDLDHKTFWSEETWYKTFANDGYTKHSEGWQFEIHANFLMAVAYRNLCIFTQLVKV